MPKLSIITVNLNDKAGLINTARSVIAQTWKDYEWIIIDGGSTDGSVDVIKEYAKKTDKLVYWCSEPDGGIYQGMNKGIEKANGEYCWFLNSGDYAYKNTTLAEIFANEFNEDIVYGDIVIPKYRHGKDRLFRQRKKITLATFLYNSLKHQASFIKRNLFDEIGKYCELYKICADQEFFVKSVILKKKSYKKINIVFAYMDGGGISTIGKPGKKPLWLEPLFPQNYKTVYIRTFFTQEALLRKLSSARKFVVKTLNKCLFERNKNEKIRPCH